MVLKDDGWNKEEIRILRKLNTPRKIQDYLNELRINFEEKGDTCLSPRMVLRSGKAHCVEGAIFAAAVLKFHGERPWILDLEANNEDFDHVICVFWKNGYYGAISKTNHAVLRYREPVYKTLRELVMSFFHEYFINSNGKKTLRRYSDLVDLSIFDDRKWEFLEDVWFIPEYLSEIRHFDILERWHLKSLRKADDIEMQAGKIVKEKDPLKRKDGLG